LPTVSSRPENLVSSTVESSDGDLLAAGLGIHRIPVPTPFAVGDVNTYLIDDDPLTLVDCGPNSASALAALEDGVNVLGRRLGEIELVLVTHQHIDHVGLAREVTRRSGADLACLGLLAPVLEEWERHAVQDDDDAQQLMLRHGINPQVAEALRAMADLMRGWGTSMSVADTFEPGDEITLRDRRLTVRHHPGHSPSDTVFLDRASGAAFVGDHLLADISSNALISRPLTAGWDGRRPTPLLDYRRSLLATRELDISIALTGHGRAVLDHRDLIDSRLAQQRHRAERFHALLAEGPRSAHEIATEQWGQVAVSQAFLTLSEVLGVLDLLIEDGRVTEDRDGPTVRFRQT
jgi:glyoxylase-like metal-dependent hydrolase (beta-lactamase superfamily II)